MGAGNLRGIPRLHPNKDRILNAQSCEKIAIPASPGEQTRDKRRQQLTYARVGVDDQLLRLCGHGLRFRDSVEDITGAEQLPGNRFGDLRHELCSFKKEYEVAP